MADISVVTAKYGTIITAIGKEKIAAAILAGKKVIITHAAVGDGGGAYYKPTGQETALINELWRGEIASAVINEANPNMIDVKFTVPADNAITVREAMVVDSEGDAIAIWNTPDAQVTPASDGASFPLVMVSHIVVESAAAVEFIVNPALDTVSREEMKEAFKAHSAQVGSAIIRNVAVPTAAWVGFTSDEPGFEKYHYTADIAIEGCTEKHFPVVAIAIPSEDAAAAAGMSKTSDTFEGCVRLYAVKIPTQDLTATIQLRTENLAESLFGDFATDEEAKGEIDDAFGASGGSDSSADDNIVHDGYTVATEEDAMATINGNFNT